MILLYRLEKMEKKNKVYKTIMLVILTAFITFMITAFSMYSYFSNNSFITLSGINNSTSSISNKNSSDLEKYLKKIKATIDKYYLWNDKIDEEKLQTGAVKGYVEGLEDEYTEYIPADEMKEYKENIVGNFVGIGIYMRADEDLGRVVVYYPIPNSPAEKAGIKAGDLIIKVNGTEYTSKDFENISNYIKGEEGSTVNILVERNGERLSFDIVREKINTNPITIQMLDNNIGYLKLPSFDEGTAKDFEEKVKELKSEGAKSLIIDLRNNGGGLVTEALDIADYIVDKGNTLLITVDKNDKEEIEKAKSKPIVNMPIIILVNENTASASEILAGALKDNDKAKIVGVKTYGKGVIQQLMKLSNGSGLKVTIEEYFTPKRNKINGVGIEPDEVVELPDTVENVLLVKEEEDTQLQKAIEMLENK